MQIVTAEAPTRIDLAGGTLDIPPLYLFHHPAMTVNMAIELNARIKISSSPKIEVISRDQNITAAWNDPGEISWREHPRLELILRAITSFQPQEHIRVEVDSEAPAGSGLGGSSVIAIALTAALAKWFDKELSEEELIDYAKSIETQTIKIPAGYQDYWGAMYGNIHAYEMGLNGKMTRTPLGSEAFHREVERHALLVYAGKPHFSATNNWELFKRHMDGEQRTIDFFETLKENATFMKEALQQENISRVAEALNKDWQTRKAMLPEMTTPEIEKLVDRASQSGSLAARVCGAGGGGCVFFIVNPEKRKELETIAEKMNMKVLPIAIAKEGIRVITSD